MLQNDSNLEVFTLTMDYKSILKMVIHFENSM